MLNGEELEKDENDDPDPRGATVILVMPMYNRGALREAIAMGLSWALKVRIAHDVANGLEVLVRANIIHRDIKTTNVLIDDGWRAKLCDFNLAIDDSSSAKGDFVAGTEEFMSPEALLGEDYSFSSDIFSFGIMLFEMLCECVPGEAGFMVRSPRDMFVLDMDDLNEKRTVGTPDSLWTIATDCCDPDVDVRPDASYASSWLSDILKDEFEDDVQVPQPITTPIQPLKDDLLDREGKQAASTRSNVRRKLLKGLRPEDVSKMRQLAQNLADRPLTRRLSCDVTAPLGPSMCSSQNCDGGRRKTFSNLPLLPSNDSNQCVCRPLVENGTEDISTLTAFQRQVNGVEKDKILFSVKKRMSYDQRRLSAISSLGTEGSSPKEGEICGCYQSGDEDLRVPCSAESDTEETPVKRDSPSPKIETRAVVVDTERVHPRQYTRALFRRSFSQLGDQEADRIRKISLINMRASSDPLLCCEGVQDPLEKVNDLISRGYIEVGGGGSEIEQQRVSQEGPEIEQQGVSQEGPEIEQQRVSQEVSEMEQQRVYQEGPEIEQQRVSQEGSETEQQGASQEGSEMEQQGASQEGSEMEQQGVSQEGSEMEQQGVSQEGPEIEQQRVSQEGSEMEQQGVSQEGSEMEQQRVSQEGPEIEQQRVSQEGPEIEQQGVSQEGSEIEQQGVSQEGNVNSWNAQMVAAAVSPENCDTACSAIGLPNE